MTSEEALQLYKLFKLRLQDHEQYVPPIKGANTDTMYSKYYDEAGEVVASICITTYNEEEVVDMCWPNGIITTNIYELAIQAINLISIKTSGV